MQVEVIIHLDLIEVEGSPPVTSWWADSPDVAGWIAGADSLADLVNATKEGLAFFLDRSDVVVKFILDPEQNAVPPTDRPQSTASVDGREIDESTRSSSGAANLQSIVAMVA